MLWHWEISPRQTCVGERFSVSLSKPNKEDGSLLRFQTSCYIVSDHLSRVFRGCPYLILARSTWPVPWPPFVSPSFFVMPHLEKKKCFLFIISSAPSSELKLHTKWTVSWAWLANSIRFDSIQQFWVKRATSAHAFNHLSLLCGKRAERSAVFFSPFTMETSRNCGFPTITTTQTPDSRDLNSRGFKEIEGKRNTGG